VLKEEPAMVLETTAPLPTERAATLKLEVGIDAPPEVEAAVLVDPDVAEAAPDDLELDDVALDDAELADAELEEPREQPVVSMSILCQSPDSLL